MYIRVGILCIPILDEDACRIVKDILHQSDEGILMLHEASARSQRNWIEATLCKWCDEDEVDLLITIGGTYPAPGPSSAECVPEATLAVCERLLPGLAETMRTHAWIQTRLALLDRSVVGIRGRTLIINLPASATAAGLFFEAVCDLIPPVLAHLQEDPAAPRIEDELQPLPENFHETHQAEEEVPEELVSVDHGLDEDEFAAFLRRQM